MTTLAVPMQSSSSLKVSTLFKAGLTGGAVAAVANTALYGVARLGGVDFVGKFDPSASAQALMPVQPAIASLVPSFLAALVMFGFTRFFKRPALAFTILAGVAALLSLGGPLNIAEASLSTRLVLSAMHAVAAVAITLPLVRAVGGKSA